MGLTSQELEAVCSSLGQKPESLLILGAIGPAPAHGHVVGVFSLEDELPDEGVRAELAVVSGASSRHTALLSRLRDVYCRKVVLLNAAEDWSTNELRALGFQPQSVAGFERVFFYDPDLDKPPRDWNNASNWANPENFDKYRW